MTAAVHCFSGQPLATAIISIATLSLSALLQRSTACLRLRQTDWQAGRETDRDIDGWMDGWMDGMSSDRQTDRQAGRQTDRQA